MNSASTSQAPLLPPSLAQKKEIWDQGKVAEEIFIPESHCRAEYILGPSLRKDPKKYPLADGEELLIHLVLDKAKLAREIRCWPVVNTSWTEWINRVEPVYGDLWKSVGIYDAIQLSKYKLPVDKNLLHAALCFWSTSSNSFHFRFGSMTPTVLDIVALTGTRPHGEELSSRLDLSDWTYTFPRDDDGKEITAYWKLVNASKGISSVSKDEHISFLLVWLCKFLCCNASIKATQEYVHLAVALANGRELALAPIILAHLYRGCKDICTNKFGHAGGPFWILQLWIQSYFPEFRPSSYQETPAPTYGLPLAKCDALDSHSFEDCVRFFYSCSSRNSFQFTPFLWGTCGPSWCRHDPSLPIVGDDLHIIWASFLIPRELDLGLMLKGRKKKCGVHYAPNQCARQFGLTQAIPLLPHQSARGCRTVTKRNFSFVNFFANPRTTKSFDEWWSTYIATTRSESADFVLGRIFPHVAPSPSPAGKEKNALNSDNLHSSEQTARDVQLIREGAEGLKQLEFAAEDHDQPSEKAKTADWRRPFLSKSGGKFATKSSTNSKVVTDPIKELASENLEQPSENAKTADWRRPFLSKSGGKFATKSSTNRKVVTDPIKELASENLEQTSGNAKTPDWRKRFLSKSGGKFATKSSTNSKVVTDPIKELASEDLEQTSQRARASNLHRHYLA